MKNHKKSGLKNQPTPTFDKEPIKKLYEIFIQLTAGGETRTRTPFRITDFESVASAIPPHRLIT